MATFKQAQVRILGELQQLGWKVSAGLKVPHATSPDGRVRYWFRPQAIYATAARHVLGEARSLHIDPRVACGSVLQEYSGRVEPYDRGKLQ